LWKTVWSEGSSTSRANKRHWPYDDTRVARCVDLYGNTAYSWSSLL